MFLGLLLIFLVTKFYHPECLETWLIQPTAGVETAFHKFQTLFLEPTLLLCSLSIPNNVCQIVRQRQSVPHSLIQM